MSPSLHRKEAYGEKKNAFQMLQDTRQWWHMPVILALRRQRQEDYCEFEASLIYEESSQHPGLLHRKTL